MAKSESFNFFGVVINAPKEKEGADMEATLNDYQSRLFEMAFAFVATIIHDGDFKDNGEAKRTHLHAFIIEAEGLTIRQEIKRLETALKCDSDQISVEGSKSEILLVQYLTHQNHPEKHQYNRELIRTTNREKLEALLDAEYIKPTTTEDALQDHILTARTFTDFMLKVGVKEANKYRGSFNQIKQEQRTSYSELAKALDEAREDLFEAVRVVKMIVGYAKKGIFAERDIADAEQWLSDMKRYYNLHDD